MKKLSDKLQSVANGDCFYGEALYQAYELEIIVTTNDKKVLHRYMYGSETNQDRWSLQDLVIELAKAGY